MTYTPIFKGVKKILVVKFRHIGDVLLIVPTIRALKKTFPETTVSVLVNSGTEDVLTGNAVIDELIVFDRAIKSLPAGKRFMKEISFLKEIRAKGFDMTVDLTGGDRAAIISFLSGARYRLAGNPGKKGFIGKKYLYTHFANIDKQRHLVLQNLDVVGQFGINAENLTIDFFIPEDARMFVRKVFEEHNIKRIPPLAKGGWGDLIVHVHPTSKWLFKCWKDEYMAEVISWLIDKGIKVIVTSAPDNKEMEKAKRILSLCSSLVPRPSSLLDLCGKTTIKELAAISEASDLFLGVDSAPMHIAAAVGTPVIALFGPTGEEWMPYGQGHIVISKDMPCKPCKKGMCEGIELRECMMAIKPDDVKEVALKILSKFSCYKGT
ncbi:MAG: putative lipopolysaccharide heptosyltransferase III [Nitrospirae bacterium]|nr:putative lipopolysaccharide heptosyltransferase III [Nitrospirota bacterium]